MLGVALIIMRGVMHWIKEGYSHKESTARTKHTSDLRQCDLRISQVFDYFE